LFGGFDCLAVTHPPFC